MLQCEPENGAPVRDLLNEAAADEFEDMNVSNASFPNFRVEHGANQVSNGGSLTGSQNGRYPDVVTNLSNEMVSMSLNATADNTSLELVDAQENLKYEDAEDLAKALGLDVGVECKVVSIIGNTGEGKSHSLNHAFFDGKDVFDTSDKQDSCTLGVRVAYQPTLQLLFLDTEGMMGISENVNVRKRLLLKVKIKKSVIEIGVFCITTYLGSGLVRYCHI